MQFDLGAPYSLFYLDAIEDIRERYGVSLQLEMDEEGEASLVQVAFRAGDLPIFCDRVRVRDLAGAGLDPGLENEGAVIGTLGADLIEDRILVIDYPAGTLTLSGEIPAGLPGPDALMPMRFRERRVLLPAVVAGKETTLLFDTGSSAFELLTSRRIWRRLARSDAAEEIIPVSSWSDTLVAHRVATDARIALGGADLPLQRVTWIEGTGLMQNLLMRISGMGGMTGNRLFVDRILLLDLREERFALVTP